MRWHRFVGGCLPWVRMPNMRPACMPDTERGLVSSRLIQVLSCSSGNQYSFPCMQLPVKHSHIIQLLNLSALNGPIPCVHI